MGADYVQCCALMLSLQLNANSKLLKFGGSSVFFLLLKGVTQIATCFLTGWLCALLECACCLYFSRIMFPNGTLL